MPILAANQITKTYTVRKRTGFFSRQRDNIIALQNFNLSLSKPLIFGLLGPNGAGKTTFIKLCLGISQPDQGSLLVLGFQPSQRKSQFLRQIGFVSGQKKNLDANLPAKESLKLQACIYGLTMGEFNHKILNLSQLFGLTKKLDTPVRQLSLGERMKFEIIASVLHNPKILFLDEPTLGLDIESQKNLRNMLKRLLAENNVTIILTSHYLADIQETCSRVLVLDQGIKQFEGTLSELKNFTEHTPYMSAIISGLRGQTNKN